jgi:hypothetical protein
MKEARITNYFWVVPNDDSYVPEADGPYSGADQAYEAARNLLDGAHPPDRVLIAYGTDEEAKTALGSCDTWDLYWDGDDLQDSGFREQFLDTKPNTGDDGMTG